MVERTSLHKRNLHNGRYDFSKLISAYSALEKYVAPNKYGGLSIDFFDPQAVRALNRALLTLHYGIEYWDIPKHSLCPPIPGRADYIHYISDLIGEHRRDVRCLDIGVGASCIYPIIGCSEYGWSFVGSDIDADSIKNAQTIVDNNPTLKGRVELRLQSDANSIFKGIIAENDFFDLVICNPPFHESAESAEKGSLRKLRNLKGERVKKVSLNFGGKSNELWCEGGELRFISKMIDESRLYHDKCRWFTSLVSKEDNLKPLSQQLNSLKIAGYRVIEMQQGNKITRVLAWRY